MKWIAAGLQIEGQRLKLDPAWNITEVEAGEGNWGYRFWPDQLKGEGFFMACVRKMESTEESIPTTRKKKDELAKKELDILGEWIDEKNINFSKRNDLVIGIPASFQIEYNFLKDFLHIISSGIAIGEIVHGKLIPHHSLAMSDWVNSKVEKIALDFPHAIRYLQRKDGLEVSAKKGWTLVEFKKRNLGWINVLSNRINNYYPKELRILKDR